MSCFKRRKGQKLLDDDVRWIRNVGRRHLTNTEIAKMFKISKVHVGDILSGKRRAKVSDVES